MLQAMNTGHDGSLSTCHANGPADALRRIETMALMGAIDLPLAAVREQILGAVDLVVQVAAGRPRLPAGWPRWPRSSPGPDTRWPPARLRSVAGAWAIPPAPPVAPMRPPGPPPAVAVRRRCRPAGRSGRAGGDMTLGALLVAATLSAVVAWLLHAPGGRSRRVRARVADTANAQRADDAAAVRWPTPVPPAAMVAGGAGVAWAALLLGPVVLAAGRARACGGTLLIGRHRRARALVKRRSQLPQALERGSRAPSLGIVAPGRAGGSRSSHARSTRPRARPWRSAPAGDSRWRQCSTAGPANTTTLARGSPPRPWSWRPSSVSPRPERSIGSPPPSASVSRSVAERRALASQARASAVVLSAAPLLFALLLGMSDGAAARFLLVRVPAGSASPGD